MVKFAQHVQSTRLSDETPKFLKGPTARLLAFFKTLAIGGLVVTTLLAFALSVAIVVVESWSIPSTIGNPHLWMFIQLRDGECRFTYYHEFDQPRALSRHRIDLFLGSVETGVSYRESIAHHRVTIVTLSAWGSLILGLFSAFYPFLVVFIRPRRTRRRNMRGLCVACAYDLQGSRSGICPECGTPVPRPQPTAVPEIRGERADGQRRSRDHPR